MVVPDRAAAHRQCEVEFGGGGVRERGDLVARPLAAGTVTSTESQAAASVTLVQTSSYGHAGTIRLTFAERCEATGRISGSLVGGQLKFGTSNLSLPTAPPCDWLPVHEFRLTR